MSEEVLMPALGESVTEGTVTQWLKQVGDTVEVDEPLLEVSTDKVDTEIPSPVAGTVQEIRVQEDETVDVGTVLAVVGSGDAAPAAQEEPAQEEAPAQAEPAQEAPASEEPAQQEQAPAEEAPAAAPSGGGGGEEVVMPALGESVTEGTVTQWLKQVGDTVEVDEPLLEVSTDKVDTEIPSPVAGTVQEIRVQEDETVEVGTVLAVVGSGAAAPAASEEPAQQAEEAPVQEPAPAAQAAPAAAAQESSSPEAQPAAASGSAAPAGGGGGEEIEMPALGESVTEGTVTQWLKQVGDTVEVDEPLLEVSTDKVDTEIPSPVAGTVQEIRVQEDETVEVGTVLAVVGSGAAAPAASEEPAQQAEEAPVQEPAPAAQAAPAPAAQESSSTEAQPAAASGSAAPAGGGGGEEIEMPALGESVTEGTVTQWLKQVGDTVEVDEPLLEVSTDKVDTEIPSPVAGTVQEIRVQEDETVEVGTVLAVVGSGAAAPAASEEPAQQAEEAPVQEPAPAAQAAPAAAAQESSSPEAQPAAASGSAAPAGGGGGEEIEMPALGESVTEGTVTQWLKQVGDTVEVDEPLLEVSTDKVDTEIPSPVAGTVQEIRVQEDETVEVGTVLAVVGSGAAAPAASKEPAQQAPVQEAPAPAPAEEAPAQEPRSEERRVGKECSTEWTATNTKHKQR